MALEGWFLVAFLIIIVLVVIKAINEKQALAVKMSLAIFVFVAVSVGYVFINKGVDLTSVDGLVSAIKLYFSWLAHFGNNVAKTTGYVINQDWGLNLTNSTG